LWFGGRTSVHRRRPEASMRDTVHEVKSAPSTRSLQMNDTSNADLRIWRDVTLVHMWRQCSLGAMWDSGAVGDGATRIAGRASPRPDSTVQANRNLYMSISPLDSWFILPALNAVMLATKRLTLNMILANTPRTIYPCNIHRVFFIPSQSHYMGGGT
jgi:hypothetical protein